MSRALINVYQYLFIEDIIENKKIKLIKYVELYKQLIYKLFNVYYKYNTETLKQMKY